MSEEPLIALDWALAWAALALGIFVWILRRLWVEHRGLRTRRVKILEEFSEAEREAYEDLSIALATIRERARGWSSENFVTAKATLEAADAFEESALERPEDLSELATRAQKILEEFDREPRADRLSIFVDALKA